MELQKSWTRLSDQHSYTSTICNYLFPLQKQNLIWDHILKIKESLKMKLVKISTGREEINLTFAPLPLPQY